MSPTTYTEVLARNIRAARSRLGISQADVVERMRALGFTAWHKPTLGNVERAQRRAQAEEILGLARALETTVQRLMTPLWEDKWVEFPNGVPVRVGAVVSLVGGSSAPDEVPNDLGWYKNTPVQAIVPPPEALKQVSHDDHATGPERPDAASRQASE
jgi:transcriptional regulator with XRE-family HTH domain